MPQKNIIELEGISKSANSIESDYKSEIIAANLVIQGYDPNRIFLIRKGAMRRGFAKDIEHIDLQFSEHDLQDYLNIHTNRESIYDILPEGLFHQPLHKSKSKQKDDIIDEIKHHRQEEFFARKFFQLFEVEIDRSLSNAYLWELGFDKKISNKNFTNIFLSYWPILKKFNSRQAIIFIYVISILHKIRNKHSEVEDIISIILDVPVTISPTKISHKNVDPSSYKSQIGVAGLGVDFVLGDVFDDGIDDLKVTIGPISAQKMEYFMAPNEGGFVLDKLCDLLLTADAFVVKDFKLSSEGSVFILSGNNTAISQLGLNTFL